MSQVYTSNIFKARASDINLLRRNFKLNFLTDEYITNQISLNKSFYNLESTNKMLCCIETDGSFRLIAMSNLVGVADIENVEIFGDLDFLLEDEEIKYLYLDNDLEKIRRRVTKENYRLVNKVYTYADTWIIAEVNEMYYVVNWSEIPDVNLYLRKEKIKNIVNG